MGSSRSSGSSSSGEEDGDAEWRAAIYSVTAATFNNNNNGGSSPKPVSRRTGENGNNPIDDKKAQQIKRSQLKAQKILDDILGKTIEIVKNPPIPDSNSISEIDDGGVRLFRDAPVGIVFDHVDELQGPTKKPRLLPGREYDEKSKKFKRQLESVMVDGMDIITAAQNASEKSFAKLEAREAAAKATAKREEERIAMLKKLRGERWLPSIAGDMQIKIRNR